MARVETIHQAIRHLYEAALEILVKTGTHRQAELVSLLLRSSLPTEP